MPNVLKICWKSNELRLSLINIKKGCTVLSEGHLLEEVASEALGLESVGYITNDQLADINKIEDELENSGGERKLVRLVNRLRNNAVEFPINEIRADKKILSCQWMCDHLEVLFHKEVQDLDAVHNNEETVELKEEKEAHKLVLTYKGKEFMLLDEQKMSHGIKDANVDFNLSFSLDTAMGFVVYEKWKEDGVTKSKEINKAVFYHPIFYTGDAMKIHVYQIDGKWQFKLTHVDTGEEMFF